MATSSAGRYTYQPPAPDAPYVIVAQAAPPSPSTHPSLHLPAWQCISGMYKVDPAGQETVCTACPQEGAVGPLGATSVDQCGCPEDLYKSAIDAECYPCPRGALCEPMTTPATINLTAGWWRIGSDSVVTERCWP